MVKAEHRCNETARREAKLKEQMTSQLKDKDDMLVKEHTRAVDLATRLDHSEVEHQLTTDRALASEEQARVAKQHAKVKSYQTRVTEN